MSLPAAVSAFSHRGAHSRAAWSFLVYSALLAVALLLLSAWLVPDARLGDRLLYESWQRYAAPPLARDPSRLWTVLALADVFAVVALGAIAFLVAPAVVAATVANERRAGTLDQLRTTPQSPLALACGLILGAPARLWLLAAGPLALHVAAGLVGPLPLATLAQSLVVLAVGGATACSIGLCVALAPRQESGGAFAALGVAAFMLVLSTTAMTFAGDRQLAAWSFLHPAGALDAVMLGDDGLWRRLALGPATTRFDDAPYTLTLALVPLASLAASLMLGVSLLRASCRKLAQPDQSLLSKPLALVLFALASAAVAAPLLVSRTGESFDGGQALGLSLVMLPVAVVVGLFATPSAEAWMMGLRRGRVRWYHDAAAPHVLVWLFALDWTALMLGLTDCTIFDAVRHERAEAMALVVVGVASLPAYLLFATTRYQTAAARWGFCVAVVVHGLAQLIAIGMMWNHEARGAGATYVTLAAVLGFAVPAWVVWRQHRIRRAATLARA